MYSKEPGVMHVRTYKMRKWLSPDSVSGSVPTSELAPSILQLSNQHQQTARGHSQLRHTFTIRVDPCTVDPVPTAMVQLSVHPAHRIHPGLARGRIVKLAQYFLFGNAPIRFLSRAPGWLLGFTSGRTGGCTGWLIVVRYPQGPWCLGCAGTLRLICVLALRAEAAQQQHRKCSTSTHELASLTALTAANGLASRGPIV